MAVVSRLLSFLCCLLVVINFITQASAQPSLDVHFCDQTNDRGNYTANSTYHTNLNTLLSNLTSNTEINYGFYNLSYGENTDKVYAIGLCRGDKKADVCRSCLNKARVSLITQLCPNRKEAIGWFDDETCMLRYSNRSIFSLMENGPAYYAHNEKNATDANQFDIDVKNLLDRLRSTAASGDSRRKYAAASAPGPTNQTIYGLVQCTPDLSGPDCGNCLDQSIARIPIDCCKDKIGGRVVRPSCNMRYETSSFYEATADAPSPLPSADAPSALPSTDAPPPPSPLISPTSEGKSNTSRTAIALLLLVCLFLSTS